MYGKLIEEIVKYGRIAGERGYTPGISGNISVRAGSEVVITSSGTANGFLEKDDFSVIDFDGNVVGGNPKPSSEKFLHIEFYKKRSDVNAVVHFHSPCLTAFASSGKSPAKNVSPEIIYCFKDIPIAKYSIPGGQELVDRTSVYFDDYDVILMENHGVIAGAGTLKQAYLKLELAEEYAKTILFANLLGGAKILPAEEVEKIYLLR